IKWICPTAPTHPVAVLGGFPCAAWFDVGDLSEEGPDDFEGLDALVAHIANLLSAEPADSKFLLDLLNNRLQVILQFQHSHLYRYHGKKVSSTVENNSNGITNLNVRTSVI
ncbi:lysophospholipase, partial [Sarracenia purpurea var. burkii]